MVDEAIESAPCFMNVMGATRLWVTKFQKFYNFSWHLGTWNENVMTNLDFLKNSPEIIFQEDGFFLL